jgi:hypothetical protein
VQLGHDLVLSIGRVEYPDQDQMLPLNLPGMFRRGVSTMIGKKVPSFQFNEINELKGFP